MTKDEVRNQLLIMIQEDFYEYQAGYIDYLIENAMTDIRKMPLKQIAQFYSDETEIVAESLGIEESELQKMIDEEKT